MLVFAADLALADEEHFLAQPRAYAKPEVLLLGIDLAAALPAEDLTRLFLTEAAVDFPDERPLSLDLEFVLPLPDERRDVLGGAADSTAPPMAHMAAPTATPVSISPPPSITLSKIPAVLRVVLRDLLRYALEFPEVELLGIFPQLIESNLRPKIIFSQRRTK